MIVSCPACQTQFKVEPALLKPDGRRVRCAKCAHVWRVRRDGTPAPTGQFALRPPTSASQQAPATEPPAQPKAAADSAVASQPVPEDTAGSAAGLAETGAKTEVGAQGADATEAPPPATASPTKAEAKQAADQATRRKGGRTFKMFLLLLCLVVIALFAVGVLTGRFGPGGVSPTPGTPSTGDVAPPKTDTGIRVLKPDAETARAARGGHRPVALPEIQ